MPTPSLYVREAMPTFLADKDPHERLQDLGAAGLHDAELLALLIGIPPTAAGQLLLNTPSADLLAQPLNTLSNTLTPQRAARLHAGLELSRRVLDKGLGTAPVLSSPTDALPLLTEFGQAKREHFVCLYLNARNQVTHREVVSVGSLSASIVHPREVFLPAIQHSAASLLMAHNHPSGDVSPSQDDLALTKRLVEAGVLMGIDVLDHLIISADTFLSFRQKGLL